MYLTGDKSCVIDIDNPDPAKYPRQVYDLSLFNKRFIYLLTDFSKPRDMRLSSSLETSSSSPPSGSTTCWLTTSGWRSMSSGRNLTPSSMTTETPTETGTIFSRDQSNDYVVYRDHVPAAKSFQSVDSIIRNLEQLPSEYRDFYCRRIVQRLQSKCQIRDDHQAEKRRPLAGNTKYENTKYMRNKNPSLDV